MYLKVVRGTERRRGAEAKSISAINDDQPVFTTDGSDYLRVPFGQLGQIYKILCHFPHQDKADKKYKDSPRAIVNFGLNTPMIIFGLGSEFGNDDEWRPFTRMRLQQALNFKILSLLVQIQKRQHRLNKRPKAVPRP